MYTSTCFLFMRPCWSNTVSLIGIDQDNSHLLKMLIIQYIIKISSVCQNIKPNVLETKSCVYNALEEGIVFFFLLTILNNGTVWVKNVAELKSNLRP